MNTYKITFKRENGTTGEDRFTAATEAQARRDFKEVYRHGNGEITSVELVAENVAATKEQERKALEKIRKIVAELGPDSYVGIAFDGCFEIAEENIENDFGCSMKQRAESAAKKVEELKVKLAESEKDYQSAHEAAHMIADKKDKEILALKEQLKNLRQSELSDDDLYDIKSLLTEKTTELEAEISNAAQRIVEAADDPSSAAFQNAFKDHRAAKADLEYYTGLLTRVSKIKNRG